MLAEMVFTTGLLCTDGSPRFECAVLTQPRSGKVQTVDFTILQVLQCKEAAK